MRRKRIGADELLEQLDHFRLAGNFSDRPFVIFGHERRGFFASESNCPVAILIVDTEKNSPRGRGRVGSGLAIIQIVRCSFALERDNVGARFWDRLGWNDRLKLVLRDETRR